MRLNITTDFPDVARALQRAEKQVPFAASLALNNTAFLAQRKVQDTVTKVFDRPTRWVVKSLYVRKSTKNDLTATIQFKDRFNSDTGQTMLSPHIDGGARAVKPMEKRLMRIGVLPRGWQVVPGEAAEMDGNGNMSRGQISQLLNVLGTYTEAGYNKADARTRQRLRAGNVKKNAYGFAYWVNPVTGQRRAKHLPPGVYKRVFTGFGTSLKPILIFVNSTKYKKRLPFYEVVQAEYRQRFPQEFSKAMQRAQATQVATHHKKRA